MFVARCMAWVAMGPHGRLLRPQPSTCAKVHLMQLIPAGMTSCAAIGSETAVCLSPMLMRKACWASWASHGQAVHADALWLPNAAHLESLKHHLDCLPDALCYGIARGGSQHALIESQVHLWHSAQLSLRLHFMPAAAALAVCCQHEQSAPRVAAHSSNGLCNADWQMYTRHCCHNILPRQHPP